MFWHVFVTSEFSVAFDRQFILFKWVSAAFDDLNRRFIRRFKCSIAAETRLMLVWRVSVASEHLHRRFAMCKRVSVTFEELSVQPLRLCFTCGRMSQGIRDDGSIMAVKEISFPRDERDPSALKKLLEIDKACTFPRTPHRPRAEKVTLRERERGTLKITSICEAAHVTILPLNRNSRLGNSSFFV